MRAPISDPARLPEGLPADLEGVTLGVHVAARDSNDIAETFDFRTGDGARFRAFWENCYASFGADPMARIILVIRSATPMRDPETGAPFDKISFLCVQDQEIFRFTGEQARWFLETDEMAPTDVPSASVL